jgi:hypothetical protein
LGAWIGARMTRTPRAEDPVERAAERRVPVANEEPDGTCPSVEFEHEIPSLLGDPGGIGVHCCRADVDAPAAELHEHEHVEGGARRSRR